MALRIIRPERKIYHIPGLGIETREALGGGAAGWWEVAGKTCVAAYQPKGAASYAASLNDLSGNGNHATEGTAPSWAAGTGWTGNGTTTYLKTGVTPGANWTVFARWANNSKEMTCAIGTFNGGNTRFMLGTGSYGVWSYGSVTARGSTYAATVNAMVGPLKYVNGSYLGDNGGVWAGTGAEFYMLARNRADIGSVDYFLDAQLMAVAIYSDALSAAEVATVSAAMAAL